MLLIHASSKYIIKIDGFYRVAHDINATVKRTQPA